jgi:hypothetical protein
MYRMTNAMLRPYHIEYELVLKLKADRRSHGQNWEQGFG